MDETQKKLEEETEKWLKRLNEKIEEKGKNTEELESISQMENVFAYRDDTKHFLEEEDYVRAFEAVIYAWGILETLERLEN
jgi:hypothetical protein